MKKASRWTRRGDRMACGERAMRALSNRPRHLAVSLLQRRALSASGMPPRVGRAPAPQARRHHALETWLHALSACSMPPRFSHQAMKRQDLKA